MEAPEIAERWQRRLDDMFAQGCIVTSPDSRKHSYAVARPEVVAMRGINPVILFELSGTGRSLAVEVTSWTEVQKRPCNLVRLTVSTAGGEPGDEEEMVLSGNVTPGQAAVLRRERRESLRLSGEGALYQGRRWFGDET